MDGALLLARNRTARTFTKASGSTIKPTDMELTATVAGESTLASGIVTRSMARAKRPTQMGSVTRAHMLTGSSKVQASMNLLTGPHMKVNGAKTNSTVKGYTSLLTAGIIMENGSTE